MALNEAQLARSEERYEELAMQMADPAVAGDPPRYIRLVQEYNALEPIVQDLRDWRKKKDDLEQSRAMLEETNDAELRELAHEDIAAAEEEMAELEKKIQLALIPKDPLDDKNVIMEIRAGTGGEEAALFAAELFDMYRAYAASKGWNVEVIDASETELGGMKEIVFEVEGQGAYSFLKYERGTHRVQRIPATESGGRIHTSAATVAVLPEADEVDVEINPNDLRIDTYRSSGAGGQHVNKTSSAIRITHLPTGLVVTSQDQRSQHQNRDKAMQVLRARLLEMTQSSQDEAIAAERRSQVGSGDRSERIRTYNYPQSRVTDHRVNLSSYQLEQVLAGDLDFFIRALQAQEHEAKLAARE